MRNKKLLIIGIIGLTIFFVTAGAIFRSIHQKPVETIEERINSIIDGFDFNNPQSFYAVSEIPKMGKETLPYLREMINSESIYERWAAVLSLSALLRENPDLKNDILPSLKKVLEDKNDTLKMLAGAQLLFFGRKEGIPVLISLLNSDKITHIGTPELIKERSLLYLRHYIDFKGNTLQEWQKFWQDNEEMLFWNENNKIFEIK